MLDEIRLIVEKFNSLLPYAAGDFLIYQAFKRNPTSNEERSAFLSMRMETINFVLQGGLRLKPSIRHKLVIGDFGICYWQIV